MTPPKESSREYREFHELPTRGTLFFKRASDEQREDESGFCLNLCVKTLREKERQRTEKE